MMRSSSSIADLSVRQKWKEAVAFLSGHLRGGASLEGFDRMFGELDDYRATYERYTQRSFAEANMLEIGYGTRAARLIALMSMGIDARGIDLDMPMLTFSPIGLFRILKRNGFERALKTGVRSAMFDRRDRQKLRKALGLRGYALCIDRTRFLVGDAATYEFGPKPIDLVYSNDVFEHIPPEGLESLLKRLAAQISPRGLALITPNIFTGITGGHLPEWYGDEVAKDSLRESEPWEHLRKRRYKANTYLNGLTRSDYRELFSRFFEILEEKVMNPELGRRFLTPEVQAELKAYSDDELFSNRVQFALSPKGAAPFHSL
jgi:hypothetical protein